MLLLMAFRMTVAQIEAAALRLRHDRDTVSGQVEALLDGWRGAAATAYGEGWTEWRDGADLVLAGLEAMVRLLGAVEVSFVETDGGRETAIGRIAARLG
jgi:ESAT-6 family protein